MSGFMMRCYAADDREAVNKGDNGKYEHDINISLSSKPNDSQMEVSVHFNSFQYKKKRTQCYYGDNIMGVHIFVLGMVFINGEQRNHIKNMGINNSIDEESLLALYSIGGVKELQRLSGEHNLIIVDENESAIYCLTSKLGLLPLFYANRGRDLIVSNNLAVLSQTTGYSELNKAVLAQLILYNYSLTDDSLIKKCYVIPAGSLLVYKNKDTSLERYWTPGELLGLDTVRGEQAIDMIDDAFDKALFKFMKQIDNCAISLTGGWDGRLILAYALKHISSDNLQLYSFGTKDAPDVTIPEDIAFKMGMNYTPFILDKQYLDNFFLGAASETAIRSNGYRSIQRAHYLFAMEQLAKNHNSIISGICGSNVMKSAPTTASVVFNRNVLDLLNDANVEKTLEKQFATIKKAFPFIFAELSADDFFNSIVDSDIKYVLQQRTYSQKASYFTFSILERKFFGSELASYQHLIGNYSPFIDSEFLDILAHTEFFNAYKSNKGIYGNRMNAVLYAKLMLRHNKRLAAFPSDKGVSLSELLNPWSLPVVAMKQLYRRRIKKHFQQSNYYNTGDTLQCFINHNFRVFSDEIPMVNDRNMFGNYLTAMYWYSNLTSLNSIPSTEIE